MTEDFKKLFDPGISPQERDLRCAAMYGKPFLNVADALRLEDMKRGAESGEYLILRASTDENGVMEVEFACLYTSDLSEMGMLYE